MRQAVELLQAAADEHRPVAIYALFSGGHDSLVSTFIASHVPGFTAAVHINTGIGIEATRTFVRETCQRQGWPLIEMHPDRRQYTDLVLEKGFPKGPKSHNTMYYWLKQRQVRRLVREAKRQRGDRVLLVTGIRASESQRRMLAALAVPVRRDGAQVWVNPILHWTAQDCQRLMEEHGLAPNPVVQFLHRSGECLCGALARAEEIKEIDLWYPDAGARIHALEDACRAQGLVDCTWAAASRGPGLKEHELTQLPLCFSCEARVA